MDVLTCPECSARFAAPQGAAGRSVRCGACGHVWRTEGEGDGGLPIPEGIRPEPRSARRRASSPRAPPPRKFASARLVGYAGAVIVGAVLAAGLFLAREPVVEAWPEARAAFALLRAEPPPPGAGLAFDHVTARADGGRIALSGTVLNLADRVQRLPPVEAVLSDASGAEHGRWAVPLEVTSLDAQGQTPISVRLPVEGALPGAPALTLRFVLF